jgi:hypothetical protein
MATKYSSLYAAPSAVSTSSGAISSTASTYAYIGPSLERAGDVKYFEGTVSVPTALATADVIKFFDVPKGFRLISINLEWGDLDTDGSPAVDIDVGLLTQNPDAYLNGGTAFQSADTTAAGNSLTINTTELAFDEALVTADADVVGMTVIAGAVAQSAAVTISFKAVGALAE